MPYSLVLNLIPSAAIPSSHLSGRHLHALFLDLVQSVDPELATFLHGQQTEKAFTLSLLQTNPQGPSLQWEHQRAIAPHTPCWWRITFLDDSLFSKLTQLWLNLSPQHAWSLGGTALQVASILGTSQPNQPWAGVISYASLHEQSPDDERKIHLSFCTPTAFGFSDYDCALPSRDLVFKSLLKRWNKYSGIPFSESIIEHIYPSFFDIRTEIVTDSRSKFIGCVGEITFQVLGNVEPAIIKQVNTLGQYAFYAGIGRKTPMGMGQIYTGKLKAIAHNIPKIASHPSPQAKPKASPKPQKSITSQPHPPQSHV